MPRLTDVDAILFPVEQRELYSEVVVNGKTQKIAIPNYKVVVNRDSGQVLSVVSRDYQIITNPEAIELGRRCCREVFELNEAADLEIFNVDAPSTGSYCYIDLVHKGYTMNLWDSGKRPEIYVPYVRVTNSYNKTRALRFDVGFCRKICFNGIIFEQQTIRFTFSHVRHELHPNAIQFDIKKGQLKKLFSEFDEFATAIRDQPIPNDYWEPIARRVLGIPTQEEIDQEKNETRRGRLKSILWLTRDMLRRYQQEMGDTGYALFNALSEMASNRSLSENMRKEMNAMQREVGRWLSDFRTRIAKNDFNVDSYCKESKMHSPEKTMRFNASAM